MWRRHKLSVTLFGRRSKAILPHLLADEHPPQDAGALVVVLIVVFDETPTVDINDVALVFHPQQIKATHTLTEAV